MAKAQNLAVSFGALSAGLGAAYALAPRRSQEAIGLRPTPSRLLITEAVAAREFLVAGALAADGRAGRWLASRVGGDVADMAMVALAMRSRDADRSKLTIALGALMAIFVVDLAATYAARAIERTGVDLERGQGESSGAALALADGAIHQSVTIAREPADVYEFWRKLENLPQFMKHLERVEMRDQTHSHWVATGPMGSSVEWDAEITRDEPGRLIAWRSVPGSQVWNTGEVRFDRAPADRGTEVRVRLDYSPPAGAIGVAVARLLGEEPKQQIAGDLRRLKQLLAAREVVFSEGILDGHSIRQRPAQPMSEAA